MGQSGLIIRLIDIVLILLFGFISISEISSTSVIQLPQSKQMLYSFPDRENLVIIGITAEGKFLVENESEIISDFNNLKYYITTKLQENRSENIDTRVRIRSNWNTPIKYTLAVANFCDYLKIPKGVEIILKGGK
ncbi:MAG: biopolymer transporter ExbD [candidate division KSB1 bacterium]|nr:biopolymer transporter ExbD [candidate division KSB1 bacterium]MDZ7318749.1 biopolymer transporter ExbD [candidate division KSB1 bacterium]MDZ7340799.1 biopolymer transporter ExbD [candidate division KSB1 bacterium]